MDKNKNKEKSNEKVVKKGLTKSVTIFLGVVIFIVGIVGGYFLNNVAKNDTTRTIEWVIKNVSKYGYYLDEDTGEIREFTGEEIADKIIESFLDEYSDYYTAQEYSEIVKTNKGNNFGIGVTFLTTTTDLKVFRVIGNSPSERAGLKKGDVVSGGQKDGGEKVAFSTRTDFTNFLNSLKKDETFTLFFNRGGTEQSASVSKSVFTSSYVKYYDKTTVGHFINQDDEEELLFVTESSDEMSCLDEKTAYISFYSFSGQAVHEIDTVMEHVRTTGKTKVILDLRDNGGGQMDILCDVASHFVYSEQTDSPVVAYAKDSKGRLSHYSASDNLVNQKIEKFVVLANSHTASASECLIGAMLHHAHAFSKDSLIIEYSENGKATTYGKGIMQRTFVNHTTGEALKLTTAQIYFPDKVTTIHGKGISTTPSNTVSEKYVLERALEILAN